MNVIGPLRRTGTLQALTVQIHNYNNHRTIWGQSQRHQALDEIQRWADQYAAAIMFNPSGLMQSMKNAHEALVKYANSERKPEDFAAVVSALEVFKNNAQQIATAVQQLRNIRQGG